MIADNSALADVDRKLAHPLALRSDLELITASNSNYDGLSLLDDDRVQSWPGCCLSPLNLWTAQESERKFSS